MRMPVYGPDIASEFVLPFEVCANCFRQIYGVGIFGMDETDESQFGKIFDPHFLNGPDRFTRISLSPEVANQSPFYFRLRPVIRIIQTGDSNYLLTRFFFQCVRSIPAYLP